MSAGILSGLLQAVVAGTTYLTSDKDGVAEKLLEVYDSKTRMRMSYDGSVGRILDDFIVEPYIIISKNADRNKVAPKVLNMASDMFTSFYIQTYEVMRNVLGIDLASTIKLLGTDNSSIMEAIAGGTHRALEKKSYLLELANIDKAGNLSLDGMIAAGLESNGRVTSTAYTPENQELNVNRTIIRQVKIVLSRSGQFDKEITRTSSKAVNKNETDGSNTDATDTRAADGTRVSTSDRSGTKLTKSSEQYTGLGDIDDITGPGVSSVKYKERIDSIELTITIRMNIVVVDSVDEIVSIATPDKQEYDFMERLHDVRSGSIRFWRDLVLCSDIINEYKNNRLKDKSRLFKIIKDRTVSANTKYATYDMAGFEKGFNIVVIDNFEKEVIDTNLKTNIFIDEGRDRFLSSVAGLMLCVLDDDHERLTIAIRDMRGLSYSRFSELELRKDKTNNYDDMVRAMQFSVAPKF